MRRKVPGLFACAAAILVVALGQAESGIGSVHERDPEPAPSAFAIVAFDSLNQEWGVAAASRWIAIGARSLDARAGAGAWASLLDPERGLATLAIDRMERGSGAREALDSLLAGNGSRAGRQIALIDRYGITAAFTGARCPAWAGERAGAGYLCQGALLRGDEALAAMGRGFETGRGTLGDRLLAALGAAEDVALARGRMQSAALLIVREGGGPDGRSDRMTDLRVDASADAIAELKRVHGIHATTFLPAAYARFGDEARRVGDLLSAEREYTRAETGFRSAVARTPKDPDALNELAWFLAAHGRRLEEAIRYAEAALVARPDDPNLHDTLAEAQYRSGSLAQAIESMERAVKLSGGSRRYAERLARLRSERSAVGGPVGTDPASQPGR